MAGAAEAEGGPKTTRGESGRGEKRSPQRGVSISEARSTKKRSVFHSKVPLATFRIGDVRAVRLNTEAV